MNGERETVTNGHSWNRVMGIFFDSWNEPLVLKESDTAERQLTTLKELEPQLNAEGRTLIERDIACLEYGIAGEKNIAFELANSHLPMVVLHDIYLSDGEQNAQIDYLVFTRKLCFVIECKNLYGNITIDSNGSFIRTMYFGTHKVQEGIYSPITQNERHLELMKKMKSEAKSNALLKWASQKFFAGIYRSVVVLANPKTVLNDRYAKKQVRDQVIRADQLVNYIREELAASKEDAGTKEDTIKWA